MSKYKYNNANNIFSYSYNRARSTGLWNTLKRISRHVRRYLFISRLIKIMTFIIALIETSATLVIAATAVVIAVPIAVLSIAVTAILSLIKFKKHDPAIKRDIDSADKIVFIEARKGYFRNKTAYLHRMARCFRDEGYTVFIVSHSYRVDRFLSARMPEERIWVIHLNYYYNIKRKLLKNKEDKLTYIY